MLHATGTIRAHQLTDTVNIVEEGTTPKKRSTSQPIHITQIIKFYTHNIHRASCVVTSI